MVEDTHRKEHRAVIYGERVTQMRPAFSAIPWGSGSSRNAARTSSGNRRCLTGIPTPIFDAIQRPRNSFPLPAGVWRFDSGRFWLFARVRWYRPSQPLYSVSVGMMPRWIRRFADRRI